MNTVRRLSVFDGRLACYGWIFRVRRCTFPCEAALLVVEAEVRVFGISETLYIVCTLGK